MREPEKLTAALRQSLSGVNLSPWAAHRMAEAIAEQAAPVRSRIAALMVGAAVTVVTTLWPLAAASEMLI